MVATLADLIVVVALLSLLVLALILIRLNYICDEESCGSFDRLDRTNSRTELLSLLDQYGRDGIWPFAYLGALLIASLSFWITQTTWSLQWFLILVLVSFMIIYALFQFFLHHYLKQLVTAARTRLERDWICHDDVNDA